MDRPVKLVLCWHMHQPYYRDELHGEYHLPWVYLHAMKDYTDMAWHLEQHPDMRLVVNFTPVLLEQLLDYATRISAFLDHGAAMNDRLLNLLTGVTPIPTDSDERLRIIRDCQRSHAPTMIDPWPRFQRLIEIAGPIMRQSGDGDAGALAYLNDGYFHDLLVWYHLGWLGYSMRHREEARRLFDQGGGYTAEDRTTLVRIIHECIDGIIPRYKRIKGGQSKWRANMSSRARSSSTLSIAQHCRARLARCQSFREWRSLRIRIAQALSCSSTLKR